MLGVCEDEDEKADGWKRRKYPPTVLRQDSKRADCKFRDDGCASNGEIDKLAVEYWACWLDSFGLERLEPAFSGSKALSRNPRSWPDDDSLRPSGCPRTAVELPLRLD